MDLLRLRQELEADGLVVGGVLSGTSADGIDVGFARLRREAGTWVAPELLAFETRPYPEALGGSLRRVLAGEARTDLRATALLHRDLGRAFGRAAAAVAEEQRLTPDLIGSHGQTVVHHDDRESTGPATLQLGDPDFVAAEAGCPVVGDFRQADVAAGGGGAPLSPYADDVVFAAAPRPLCVLNLGGIANLTWIDGDERVAFDVGPANALLDGLARRDHDLPCDRDGAIAARGRVTRAVSTMAAHLIDPEWRAAPPPKSTGRDTFGPAWLESRLAELGPGNAEDRMLGAVLAVVGSIREAVQRWVPDPTAPLWVAGGGVHNPELMRQLTAASAGPVAPSSEVGVDPDAREALVFAVLAARWVAGEPVTHPRVTGARPGTVLGKLSPGPRS